MTWTWRDDDPATAASAENFNTHIEMRLRSLEVAGGGGGTAGPEGLLLFGTDLTLPAGVTVGGGPGAEAGCYRFGGLVQFFGILVVPADALPDAHLITGLPVGYRLNPTKSLSTLLWLESNNGAIGGAYTGDGTDLWFDDQTWNSAEPQAVALNTIQYLSETVTFA